MNSMENTNCGGTGKRQSGVVMVVALVMLILITLFAVSAIRSSTTELQIVGNAQLQSEMASAAQEGIESRLNTMTDFNNVAAGVPVAAASVPTQGSRYTVTVAAPVCIKSVSVDGNSIVSGSVSQSETTYWEVQSTVTDSNSGATMNTTQGLKMRMPVGSCP